MLADFQEAFAELVSSPALCSAVRREPEILRKRHAALSDKEWRRLVAIANQKGMAAACMIYRANRIVPLLMHLPLSCKALKGHLREAVSRYWLACPDFHANGFFEADRFARHLSAEIAQGVMLPDGVAAALAQEAPRVVAELEAGMQGRA
jgi:hypothetical protein